MKISRRDDVVDGDRRVVGMDQKGYLIVAGQIELQHGHELSVVIAS